MIFELGMKNEELGIPLRPPHDLDNMGGWAAFLIPNSYFLIGWLAGRVWWRSVS
jgi:hypothetical protein